MKLPNRPNYYCVPLQTSTRLRRTVSFLGTVYIEHQRQIRVNAAMVLMIHLSSNSMEPLQNGLQLYSGETVSIAFNEANIASIVAALTLTLGVNGALLVVNRTQCTYILATTCSGNVNQS